MFVVKLLRSNIDIYHLNLALWWEDEFQFGIILEHRNHESNMIKFSWN